MSNDRIAAFLNAAGNGEQNYIRNFSILRTAIYYAMKKKSIRAMNKLRLLRKYTGILVHDHETALYHFGTNHGEFNVHIIRYFKKNTGNSWSRQMVSLLCRMNKERKALTDQGAGTFSSDTVSAYEAEYQELIARGREENKKTKHRYAKKEEHGDIGKYKTFISGHTGYFLAGVKLVDSAEGRKCLYKPA